MKTYNAFRTQLKNFSLKSAPDMKTLQKSSERLNVVYTGKLCLSLIRQCFSRLVDIIFRDQEKLGEERAPDVLWSAFSMMSFEVSAVLKEQVAFEALAHLKVLLIHIKNER